MRTARHVAGAAAIAATNRTRTTTETTTIGSRERSLHQPHQVLRMRHRQWPEQQGGHSAGCDETHDHDIVEE
jgi:hypothetical protein